MDVPRNRGRDRHVDARLFAGGSQRQASLHVCKKGESFDKTANARGRKVKIRTLLTKFWFSLLHRRHDHVTDTSIGKTVQVRAKAKGLDDIKGLCAAVVCTVEDGTDGQTEGKAELVARAPCACKQTSTM